MAVASPAIKGKVPKDNCQLKFPVATPALPSGLKQTGVIDELVENCEESARLLKALKKMFSPEVDPDGEAEAGEAQKKALCAAAAAGVPRALKICFHFYCASYGADRVRTHSRELLLLEIVLRNERERPESTIDECVRLLAAM